MEILEHLEMSSAIGRDDGLRERPNEHTEHRTLLVAVVIDENSVYSSRIGSLSREREELVDHVACLRRQVRQVRVHLIQRLRKRESQDIIYQGIAIEL